MKTKFAERIKYLRTINSLTQSDVGKAVGVSPDTIRSYEVGRREPNFKIMVALENFFHVSGAYLIGVDAEPLEEKSEILKEDAIYLTIDEITTLQMHIQMTSKYREREREACFSLAHEMKEDGTPQFPCMLSNYEFWTKTEVTLKTILSKLR